MALSDTAANWEAMSPDILGAGWDSVWGCSWEWVSGSCTVDAGFPLDVEWVWENSLWTSFEQWVGGMLCKRDKIMWLASLSDNWLIENFTIVITGGGLILDTGLTIISTGTRTQELLGYLREKQLDK